MPFVHTTPFQIRHYECDADGKVHHAQYLRYMQEAAFNASAVVGYGAQKYESINLQWLAYETEIDYLHPIHYGEQIDIRTWIHDFRRVRSLRRYEFYRENTLVAQASTDWVLLNTQTNYPTTISDEIITAYARGESIEVAPPRAPFPRMPKDIPEQAFMVEQRVTWRDIDPAQHMNNAVYLHYVKDCARLANRHFGWVNQAVEMVARKVQIEYKFPALIDDTIRIATWMNPPTATGGLRYYVISRASDNKLLARFQIYWEAVRQDTQHVIDVPDTLKMAFTPNILR